MEEKSPDSGQGDVVRNGACARRRSNDVQRGPKLLFERVRFARHQRFASPTSRNARGVNATAKRSLNPPRGTNAELPRPG